MVPRSLPSCCSKIFNILCLTHPASLHRNLLREHCLPHHISAISRYLCQLRDHRPAITSSHVSTLVFIQQHNLLFFISHGLNLPFSLPYLNIKDQQSAILLYVHHHVDTTPDHGPPVPAWGTGILPKGSGFPTWGKGPVKFNQG